MEMLVAPLMKMEEKKKKAKLCDSENYADLLLQHISTGVQW